MNAIRFVTFTLTAMLFPISVSHCDDDCGKRDSELRTWLEDIPKIKLPEYNPPSEEAVEEIRELIDGFSKVKSPCYGVGRNFHQIGFGPIGAIDLSRFTRIKSNLIPANMKRLIEIGPDAIPLLLEALEEHQHTALVFSANGYEIPIFFTDMRFGNVMNPRECLAFRLNEDVDMHEPEYQVEAYRVKVGDLCFATLGQIVGRYYEPVMLEGMGSASYAIRTPVHDKAMRDNIRMVWSSPQPRQHLLDSLLLDYSTRNASDGKSLDGWSYGNDIQLNAIIRMVYYFPENTASLIEARLDQLDVSPFSIDGAIKNGIRANDFVKVVGWSKNQKLRDALSRMVKRATDPDVIYSLNEAGIEVPGQ